VRGPTLAPVGSYAPVGNGPDKTTGPRPAASVHDEPTACHGWARLPAWVEGRPVAGMPGDARLIQFPRRLSRQRSDWALRAWPGQETRSVLETNAVARRKLRHRRNGPDIHWARRAGAQCQCTKPSSPDPILRDVDTRWFGARVNGLGRSRQSHPGACPRWRRAARDPPGAPVDGSQGLHRVSWQGCATASCPRVARDHRTPRAPGRRHPRRVHG
jgi:hypothetical protein